MDDATSTAVASTSTGTPDKPVAKPKRLGRGLLDLLSSTPVEVRASEFTVAVDAAEREVKSFVSATPVRQVPAEEVTAASVAIDEAAPTASSPVAGDVAGAASGPAAEVHSDARAAADVDESAAADAVAPGIVSASEVDSLPTPEEELAAIAGNLEAAVRLLSEHRDTPLLLLQRSLRAAWAAAAVAALLLVGVVWWAASTTSVQQDRIDRLMSELAGQPDTLPVAPPASVAAPAPVVVDRTAEVNRLTQELDMTRSALTKANAAIDELMSKSNRQ